MTPIPIQVTFRYPHLLDFLKEQEFSDKIAKINFKPIIKSPGLNHRPATSACSANITTSRREMPPWPERHGEVPS